MSRLAVLTARPDLPVYRDLEAAGRKLGHQVVTLDALRLVARAGPPGLWSGGADPALAEIRAVLPRVGNWRPDSTLAVLSALQRSGVPSLNDAAAIRTGRDHWLTACALASAGLPHPETLAGSEPEALAAAAGALAGFPCVVKLRRSRRGVGVIRCVGAAELEAVLDSLWRLGEEPVVQRFCLPGGVSRRVLVLGSEALGAAEHRAGEGDFRANAARGAKVRSIELDRGLADLAVSAARVVGLGFAGVDLIPDGERWLVGEVNPSPGWKHFAAATGVPVAERLVAALASLAGVDRRDR
ncbi:MAG TPA: RimK family alpha-L-glutamate ligase [Thermoanaerobaculaceae bacterium]|nr:RimK family alpha-L-glutamate ligase [Thermoanaerobaculaceae bacterium]